MKRKLIFIIFVFLLAVSYFVWSFKDKDLKFIPENSDIVVLIDTKETSKQYFFTLLKNPSQWFTGSGNSFKNTGFEIPDFVQIFHLKNTSLSEWYSVFEISDKNDFLKFLTDKGFKLTQNNIYTKDQFAIRIDGSKCIIGFSNQTFGKQTKNIINSKTKKIHSDQLINNSVGSVSYLSESKIHNFAVYLNDDNVEIKKKSVQDFFPSTISDLEKQTQFLNLKLDSKNTKIVTQLFNKEISDSININSINAFVELESVNDTIVSYGYDDDFNEIEKVSYQKLIQPNYMINFQSSDLEKTWSYFQNKKWINAQNQFTLIPFQPNLIEQTGNEIVVKSLRKSIASNQNLSGNYFFLKNSKLFKNLLGTVSKSGAKTISDLDYVFYGNKADYYYIKLKFKKEKLPIILR